jgi:hypothetical protein
VDHAAGGEEEQGLEGGVRKQMEDAWPGPFRTGCHRDSGQHVRHLADRRVGQQPFQVVLGDRRERGPDHADRGDHGGHLQRPRHRQVKRKEPGDQEHPGGHHRGRVDQGGNRGRAFHRIR